MRDRTSANPQLNSLSVGRISEWTTADCGERAEVHFARDV